MTEFGERPRLIRDLAVKTKEIGKTDTFEIRLKPEIVEEWTTRPILREINDPKQIGRADFGLKTMTKGTLYLRVNPLLVPTSETWNYELLLAKDPILRTYIQKVHMAKRLVGLEMTRDRRAEEADLWAFDRFAEEFLRTYSLG